MLSPSEQALWQLNCQINDRGIHIDRALITAALKIAEAATPEIDAEIEQLTDGIELGQIKKLSLWAQAHGYPEKSLGRETIEAVLEREDLDLPPELRRVLELRLDGAHAAVHKLNKMLLCAADDDRIRALYKFHGISTGRFTGQVVQPQNLKRPTIEDLDAAIAVILTGDYEYAKETLPQKPLAAIGDLTRSMITAAPGHQFYGGDYSGIEARILAWMAGETAATEAYARFDRTHDPADEAYRINAGKVFDVLPGQVTKDQRVVGKVMTLAFGFQGALPAFRKFERDYGLDPDRFTDDNVFSFLRAWREAHPRICQFWDDIDNAALDAVHHRGKIVRCGRVAFKCAGAFLWMKLPSGRKLAYPFPYIKMNAVVYMDNGKQQFKPTRNGEGAYGGVWTENCVSGTARDLFAEAMQRVEAAGYPIVMHCHDEIVVEVAEGFGSLEEFKQLMMTPLPNWASDLPIAVEAWQGRRYTK